MTQKNTRRGQTQENSPVVINNKGNIPELVSGSSTQAVTKQPALKMPGPRIKIVRGGTSGNVPVRQLSYFTTRGFILRPSLPSSVGMRDKGAAHTLYPALQACGVTKRSVRGFTLIELLVVVLIIGILATVALPQYNKAVYKARATKLAAMVDAYQKAIDLYVLEYGYENAIFLGEGYEDFPKKELIIDFSETEAQNLVNYYKGEVPQSGWMCENSTDYVGCTLSFAGDKTDLMIEKIPASNTWQIDCKGNDTEGEIACNYLKQ